MDGVDRHERGLRRGWFVVEIVAETLAGRRWEWGIGRAKIDRYRRGLFEAWFVVKIKAEKLSGRWSDWRVGRNGVDGNERRLFEAWSIGKPRRLRDGVRLWQCDVVRICE